MATILRFALVLFWGGLCWAGDGSRTSIYAYSEDDGSLVMSNVPADRRFTVLVSSPVATARAPARAGARRGLYGGIIERVASEYGLESALLHAVIETESGYDPTARSPKGAGGLMQLMPATAARYGVADAFDPEQNIEGGAQYLRDLLQMFDSNLSLALAAYNAGENAVIRNQNQLPQYRETLRYVPKVLANYRRNKGGVPPDSGSSSHP